jgi:hypothetical protein
LGIEALLLFLIFTWHDQPILGLVLKAVFTRPQCRFLCLSGVGHSLSLELTLDGVRERRSALK